MGDDSTFVALFRNSGGFVQGVFFQARDWHQAGRLAYERHGDMLIAVSGAVGDSIRRGERDLAFYTPEFEYRVIGGEALEW